MTKKRMTKAQIKRRWYLSGTELKAIQWVGTHRKSHVYPHRKSCPVSTRTANKLIKRNFMMSVGRWVMLTERGEHVFTALKPYSKWRIKS